MRTFMKREKEEEKQAKEKPKVLFNCETGGLKRAY